MKRQILLLGLILFFAIAFLPAQGNTDNEPVIKDGDKIQITGTVRLVGSALFSEIVVSTPDKTQWYITDNDRSKLYDLQQRSVTIEGTVYTVELSYGNGRRTITRHELHDIRIIVSN